MSTNIFDNFFGLKAFHEEMVEFTKYNPDKTVSEAMEAVKLILLHKFNDREMILDSSSIRDCNINPGDLLAANSEDGSSEFYFVVKSLDNNKITFWTKFDSNKIYFNSSVQRCYIKNIRFVPDIESGIISYRLAELLSLYMWGEEFKSEFAVSFDLDKYIPFKVFELNTKEGLEKLLYLFSFRHKDGGETNHVFVKENNELYIEEEE